jgi:cell division transport system permease protein
MIAAAVALAVVAAGAWGAFAILRDDDPCKRYTSHDLAVFLRDDITEPELESLRDDLDATAGVESFTYLSKEEAYQEFKDLYSDRPEIYETVPEDSLPASLRVDVEDGASIEEVALAVNGAPGIDDVRFLGVGSSGPCPEKVPWRTSGEAPPP